MKISLSSLYFTPLTSADLKYLSSVGVKAVELVIFHQFGTYDFSKEMVNFKSILVKNNIEVSGIQGFTFKPETDLKKEFFEFSITWIEHLNKLVSSSSLFSSKKLIFGAPSFRSNANDKENFIRSFIRTVDYLKLKDIDLLLEAVPEIYGAKFLNTMDSVLAFNKTNGLLTHFDTGCYLNESEKSYVLSPGLGSKIDHLHVSSTNLGQISKDDDLIHWIAKFGLPKANDNFIVLESTLMLQNVTDVSCDINYLKNIVTSEKQFM